ncbi:MAG: TolC family protein [Bacteriovoracaceae bacterium]
MKYLIMFLLLFVSFSSFSMTVSELAQMAIERSGTLSAQEMEARALQSEATVKGRWQNPQIMGQFGTLKSGSTQGPTVELSFTQPIPLSDKFSLRKDLATMAMGTQTVKSEFFKNWVTHQAILSAWKYYVFNELFQHGTERAKRITLIKRYMETRPKVSVRQRVELSTISSLVLSLEGVQSEKARDLQMAKDDLEFWIGKKVDVSELPFKLPNEYKVNNDFEFNLNRDMELIEAKRQFQFSTLDRELAQKEKRPDLILGGGYRIENVDPTNHFTYAIVGLNIPLWDTGSGRLESARARESRDQKYLEEAERKIELKQRKQVELVKFSLDQLKRFPPKFIQVHEKSIVEAESGFKQGLLDVNTFLQAETQAHEVIDQVFMYWIAYLENISSLQLMKGEFLNWESK